MNTRQRKWQLEQINKSKCIICGRPAKKTAKTKLFCGIHIKNNQQSSKRFIKTAIKKKLCTQCHRPLQDKSKRRCAKCLKYQRQYQTILRAKKGAK